MLKSTAFLLSASSCFLPGVVLAVDTTSDAYKAGSVAGKVIVAIVVIIIVKKLFFGSK